VFILSDYREAIIRTGASEVGLFLDQKQIQLFLIYLRELKEWNQKINLTSLKKDASIIKNHFIDSLSIIPHLPSVTSLLDMGSGAGFPGVPVKIARPSLQVTLLEATRKKANFLRHLIRVLELSHITTLEGRAEAVTPQDQPRLLFDIVTSRALTRLKTFLVLGTPFVKKGGYLLAMKGAKAEEELLESQKTLRNLSLAVYRKAAVQLPGIKKKRWLILLKKS
jgi:16S rRNA (guanine527-N7)-methyltransferase